MGEKLTEAEQVALRVVATNGPLSKDITTGWGRMRKRYAPLVRERIANRLLSLGFVERWDVEDDPRASTIRITPAGRAALDQNGVEHGG